jgi:hypothetical protein
MNKRDLRLELCRRALALAEHPEVSITTGLYAHKATRTDALSVCVLGGLTHEALAPDMLGNVVMGATTVAGAAFRYDFYRRDTYPDFIREVLTLIWDVEDVVLMETAFEGDLSYLLGKHVRLRSGPVATLWHFYNTGQHENTLKSLADRNLVGQFGAARVLRQYITDDRERYRCILKNVLTHGGLYNPRGR